MTAPTSPLPASLLRAEAEEHDLDARILQAEQRLIAREENLRRRVSHLGTRVHDAWQPRRWLLPVGGAALALVTTLWLGRGRRGAAVMPRAEAAGGVPHEARRGGHWVSLLGFVWPLLPPSWRARVPPSVVNLVMSVGLPLLETLLQRRVPPPLLTAGPLDPALLAGAWYEIARLPGRRAAAQPRWQHHFDESGALHLEEQPAAQRGRRPVQAVATVLAGSGGARWRVSEWPALLQGLPGTWHELAVLHLDAEGSELLLGSPGRDRLRLLSRSPELAPGRLPVLLALARDAGFELEDLQFVDRAGP